MIFPLGEFEQKLGFDQIRERLKGYCHSPVANANVDKLKFTTDKSSLIIQLKQNLEFKSILIKGEEFPSRYFLDPTEWIYKISLEGNYLDEGELLQLSHSLETIVACRKFFMQHQEVYPELFVLAQPLTLGKQLIQLITDKIDDSATVKDNASKELAQIRRKFREEEIRLRKLSEHLFRNAVNEKWVPEGALPTIREGRLVIPILAEHKRRLKGFILDESATGQTVFLEPAEMLDANNEIRDLIHAEKREVIKILKIITAGLREELGAIEQAFDFLATIDLIRAKGKLAVLLDAELPENIEDGPALTWYKARHPILFISHRDKGDIVPLDITLHEDCSMLLVSGPNAGGKSVCLKTVGLIQYMFQCGLLVPLSIHSTLGLFRDIFLDIGDQQSLENDLSTYSSHLRNMKEFIEHASNHSLILIDELGAGTDPNFGGAIAQAVLKSLLQQKVWSVITTHYYNLKLFASQEDGIENGAMRFDEKNLVPLYQLEIGKPGSSFALEIARKTGLPLATLQEAEQLVGKDLAGFETLVRDLEGERNDLLDRLQKLEAKEKELNKTLAKYSALSTDLESKKKSILENAKLEAQQLLRTTNKEIEKTIRHIRENKAQKKETMRVRQNLNTLSEKVKPEERKKSTPEALKEGDAVRIMGQEGVGIIQVLKGKNAVVQFGQMKSVVNVTKLEKTNSIARKQHGVAKTNTMDIHKKRISFNPVLDIRGKRVEEVSALLDQFMDTAILLGQSDLKVLHGKGEGILRKVVREQLKQYREVESFGDEHVEQGGDGITVVVLK